MSSISDDTQEIKLEEEYLFGATPVTIEESETRVIC